MHSIFWTNYTQRKVKWRYFLSNHIIAGPATRCSRASGSTRLSWAGRWRARARPTPRCWPAPAPEPGMFSVMSSNLTNAPSSTTLYCFWKLSIIVVKLSQSELMRGNFNLDYKFSSHRARRRQSSGQALSGAQSRHLVLWSHQLPGKLCKAPCFVKRQSSQCSSSDQLLSFRKWISRELSHCVHDIWWQQPSLV